MLSLLGLDPQTYRAHALHDADRDYPETNCYTDILIELVHARGLTSRSLLGGTVRTDFEGDQWTFFKPERQDLERLFGIDIHEMQLYRPLPEHFEEQLRHGRTMIVELDSWFLPDTQSTAYGREHVKSSAVIEGIDVDGERLRYFHNTGLYELGGADYRGVLRLDGRPRDGLLPPYAEIVRFDAGLPLVGDELAGRTRSLFDEHVAVVPRRTRSSGSATRSRTHLPSLLAGDHADYHAYAFATVRQAGSSFEAAPPTSNGSSARPAPTRRRHSRDRRRLEDPVVQAREAARSSTSSRPVRSSRPTGTKRWPAVAALCL